MEGGFELAFGDDAVLGDDAFEDLGGGFAGDGVQFGDFGDGEDAGLFEAREAEAFGEVAEGLVDVVGGAHEGADDATDGALAGAGLADEEEEPVEGAVGDQAVAHPLLEEGDPVGFGLGPFVELGEPEGAGGVDGGGVVVGDDGGVEVGLGAGDGGVGDGVVEAVAEGDGPEEVE